ncbi:hypothetical protein HUU39_19840 [candidate division KSB1 bacterium]|nr:hypothetical protein [bacterium]NUM67491.1 hypothetical protein [candidate division KSB1 bacterium]
MPLPRGDEYLNAVQNPRTAFNDLELKACSPETDQFGIPKPYSGGFTTTFHLYNHSQQWAVRCFTRAIPDVQKRYEAIGRFLQKSSFGYFVKANCLFQGIRINNQWHPIIKMEWLEGDTLNSYITKNISNPDLINKLIPEFANLVRKLEQLGIAHGDLQHGNIIVKGGKLHLIDYDGMFLPELSNLRTNEIGHINYQHPARNERHFSASIDRFASIVIYLGLHAVFVSPRLWKKYDNSDNILFKAEDFIKAETSPLLQELSSLPQLSQLTDRFQGVCRLDFDKIPTLDQFVTGNFSYPKVSSAITGSTPRRSQYLVIQATQTGALLEHVGERIEVVGYISDFHSAFTRYKRPYIFLNFGKYPNQTFTLVLWSTSLNSFNQAGVDPHSFVGKSVKVIGVIGSYRNRPQMTIEMPSQIQIMTGEAEARQWPVAQPSTTPSRKAQEKVSHQSEASVFNTLYVGRTAAPHPPTASPTRHESPKNVPRTKTATTSPTVSPPSSQKENFNPTHGVVGAILLGIIGGAVWSIGGLILGAIIGYQIGKRI